MMWPSRDGDSSPFSYNSSEGFELSSISFASSNGVFGRSLTAPPLRADKERSTGAIPVTLERRPENPCKSCPLALERF